jgi:predicted SAM-dependent methyltransferase
MDAIPAGHVDYVGDAGDLSFLPDDSIDEIYACHILEHFKRHEIADVLNMWHTKIKPGGILRISVPDFAAITAEYNAARNLDSVLGLLYGGQNYAYNYHFQAYDMKRLECLLHDAGFGDLTLYDWQDFLPDGYDDYSRAYLPHMDVENGRLMSLNAVAVKKGKVLPC